MRISIEREELGGRIKIVVRGTTEHDGEFRHEFLTSIVPTVEIHGDVQMRLELPDPADAPRLDIKNYPAQADN